MFISLQKVQYEGMHHKIYFSYKSTITEITLWTLSSKFSKFITSEHDFKKKFIQKFKAAVYQQWTTYLQHIWSFKNK